MSFNLVELSEYIDANNIRNKCSENIPVYSVTQENGFCINYFSKEVAGEDKTTYKIVPRGCFAYNPLRVNVGSLDWQNVEDRVLISSRYVVFKLTTDKIDARYLVYLLKSDPYLRIIKEKCRGTVRPELTIHLLKKIRIDLKPLSEQIAIVKSLDKIKENIKLNQNILEKYDELVKSRFIELIGDPIANPKGWPKKKMRDLLTIERGGSPRPIDAFITDDENGLNWIKIGDAVEGSYYINSVKERIKPEGLKKTRQVYPGDLILSNSMSFGKPYILNISGCIHDGWLVLHDSKDIFNKVFLCITLGFPSITEAFKGMARGGVVNNLNKDLVGDLDMIVPPKEVQDEFVEFLEQVDKSRFDTQKQLSFLKELYISMEYQYFSVPETI